MNLRILYCIATLVIISATNQLPALETDTRPSMEQRAEEGLPEGWLQCRVFGIATMAYLTTIYIATEDASPLPFLLASVGLGLLWYGTGMKSDDTKGKQLVKGLSIFAGMLCLEASLIWGSLVYSDKDGVTMGIRGAALIVGIGFMIKTIYEGAEILCTTDWWWRSVEDQRSAPKFPPPPPARAGG